MPRTLIDLHVLQTVPPSNVNRDDTGSPKTALFGGVRRARVSSQSWKRAIRLAFPDLLDHDRLGTRTKRVPELVAEAICALDPALTGEAHALAVGVLTAAGIKLEKPKKRKGEENERPEQVPYLFFISAQQIAKLAGLAVEARRQGGAGTDVGKAVDKKTAKLAVTAAHGVDVALFGRMVADQTDLNVDACCQVAHAISVHAAPTEFDYFTAVDDVDQKRRTEAAGHDGAEVTDSGAGMIGTVEFTSSTLYRYATLDVDALTAALGDTEATRTAVRAFVTAFVTSMPTGKQNTFAHRTLPDLVVAQVRQGQPVNLVGAFEIPVQAPEGGSRITQAATTLAAHAAKIDEGYGTTPSASFVVDVTGAGDALAPLGTTGTLAQLVDGLDAALAR